MSRLEELIAELCPDGVEYKVLDDVFVQFSGMGGASNKWASEGNCRFIDYMNAYTHISIDITNLPFATVKKLNQNVLKQGDVLFTSASETPDECAISSVIEDEIEDGIFLDDHLFGLRLKDQYSDIISPSFLKYAFRANSFRSQMKKAVRGVTRFYVSKPDFMKLRIPVPPLEVQREIVQILDNFTFLTEELSEELSKELSARRKQYEYYRDSLLSFRLDIPVVKLKDIATNMYRGSGIKRDQVTTSGIPCVRYGEIYTKYNTWFDKCESYTQLEFVQNPKYFEYGDILFAITGESVEDIAKSVAYVGHEKCLAGGDIVVMKHNQNPRYLAHVLSTTSSRGQKSRGKVKSKVVHSNVPSIGEIEIPLPNLEIQERFADVLDNFEIICNNLNIGLPSEIEARQKQYEHYRDLLLTFAESGTYVATDRQTDRQTDRLDDIKILQYVFGYAFCEVKDVISSLKTGLNPRKNFKLNDGGNIPYITGKDIYNNCYNVTERTDLIKEVDLQLINKRAELTSDMILFASTGTGTVGRMAYVDKYNNDWGISETLYAIKTNEYLIDPLFLMYSLYSSQAKQQFEPKISKGSVPHLKIADLLKVRISVPTLEKQKEIIKIIRSFDILCDDITVGLPAEIEARQKQYEYYRDKLLSFKEKEN